jgi:hypothetical protein
LTCKFLVWSSLCPCFLCLLHELLTLCSLPSNELHDIIHRQVINALEQAPHILLVRPSCSSRPRYRLMMIKLIRLQRWLLKVP